MNEQNIGKINSYLGHNPTCDKCGKYIVIGDEVIQTFIGIAGKDKNDYGNELGIIEYTYTLIHIACRDKA